jgi:Peptidase family M23
MASATDNLQEDVMRRSFVLPAVIALASLLVSARTARAGTGQQPVSPRTTALLVTSTNAPLRVLGSDGLEHLQYDLVFSNLFTAPVTLTAIDVIGPDGAELLRLDGDALAESTLPIFGGEPSIVVPVSGLLATAIDLTVAPNSAPAQITHQISFSLPADAPSLNLIGGRTLDGPILTPDPRAPLVIVPPLRGAGWLNANGCCLAGSGHRYHRLAVDPPRLVKPETFAIDWMQLQNGRLFSGDGSQNEQYFCFGADVVSVAAGTVVSVRDGMPEETPNQPPLAVHSAADFTGNSVVVQIAPDVWATYAHLQPDSLRVAVGDRVTAGQVLGLLGNSGNSTAPHLHFQLSDGPVTLTSNSLPYVFDRYTLAGTIDPETFVAAVVPPAGEDGPDLGAGASVTSLQGTPTPQAGTYPLVLGVVDFP